MKGSRQRVQAQRELISLRVNAGLSRRDLGARIGVSGETIRLVELGFVPGARIQFAIASAFDRQPLDLWPIERQREVASCRRS